MCGAAKTKASRDFRAQKLEEGEGYPGAVSVVQSLHDHQLNISVVSVHSRTTNASCSGVFVDKRLKQRAADQQRWQHCQTTDRGSSHLNLNFLVRFINQDYWHKLFTVVPLLQLLSVLDILPHSAPSSLSGPAYRAHQERSQATVNRDKTFTTYSVVITHLL